MARSFPMTGSAGAVIVDAKGDTLAKKENITTDKIFLDLDQFCGSS